MNKTKDFNIDLNIKNWFISDEFCCSIHISPNKRKHDDIIQILRDFVHSKLNKYLIGSQFRKLQREEQINLVWFEEGNDIFNSQISGYYTANSYIRKELRMKSTEVQRHYHILVRTPELIKNTKHIGIEFGNNISNLIEIQLRRIILEFNNHNSNKLDVVVRNNHEYDKSQQYYVTKEFSRNDNSDKWGII
jgi:hypothetical protein